MINQELNNKIIDYVTTKCYTEIKDKELKDELFEYIYKLFEHNNYIILFHETFPYYELIRHDYRYLRNIKDNLVYIASTYEDMTTGQRDNIFLEVYMDEDTDDFWMLSIDMMKTFEDNIHDELIVKSNSVLGEIEYFTYKFQSLYSKSEHKDKVIKYIDAIHSNIESLNKIVEKEFKD